MKEKTLKIWNKFRVFFNILFLIYVLVIIFLGYAGQYKEFTFSFLLHFRIILLLILINAILTAFQVYKFGKGPKFLIGNWSWTGKRSKILSILFVILNLGVNVYFWTFNRYYLYFGLVIMGIIVLVEYKIIK